MREDLNHYELAICVLRNEPDAHLILADLLDEAGDAANAVFARSPKKNLRKRFDLTVGLLPVPVVLWISCEFASHVLSTSSHFDPSFEFDFAVQPFRTWAEQQLRDDVNTEIAPVDFDVCFPRLKMMADRFPVLGPDKARNEVLAGFFLAMINVGRSVEQIRSTGRCDAMASSTAIGAAAKELANRGRKVLALTGYINYPNQKAWVRELNWQAGRLEQVVKQLQECGELM